MLIFSKQVFGRLPASKYFEDKKADFRVGQND
jgi:hypothetical protein